MPSSGCSVYQPTTTSIDGLKRRGHVTMTWKRMRYVLILVCGIFGMILGIGLIAMGSTAMLTHTMETTKYNEEEGAKVEEEVLPMHSKDEIDNEVASEDSKVAEVLTCYPVGMTVAGVISIVISIIVLTFYVKKSNLRRDIVCPCSTLFDKKQSFARQLQTGGVCGQNMMNNPSSDPLVSHPQYAPVVSELPSSSLRCDDEERRNLMPCDNKDCLSSAEESDRMIEPDPRIVLRPMGHVDEA